MEFLRNVSSDIENGVYQINSRVKVIVSEYETKPFNDNGYEAHRRYIDIQFVARGAEKVCCLPLDQLSETKPYNVDADAAFYASNNQPLEMGIGNGYFAIFFPQDGHMPCLCIGKTELVKKIVIKVKL